MDEPTTSERAFFSLIGVMRFDAEAVAEILRSRPLSPLEIECLAKMIDGTHPGGLRLTMKGQGKGWKPIFEKAVAYDRLMAIGEFVDAQLASGCSVEEAVIDAASKFSLSEPTVYRDLSLYRHVKSQNY